MNSTSSNDEHVARTAHMRAAVGELSRGAGGTWAVNAAGMGVAFVLMLVLARALGARGYGALTYTLAWAEVLAMLATLGFDKLLIRELAVYRHGSQWQRVRGLLRCAAQWTGLGVLIAVSAALAFSWFMGVKLDPAMRPVFWLVVFLVPVRAWCNLRHGALLGLSRPVAGMAVTIVSYPLVFLLLVAAWLLIAPQTFSAAPAAMAALGGLIAAVLIADMQMRRRLDRAAMNAQPPEFHLRQWLGVALPMMLIVAMALVNLKADLIMLGAMRGAEAAGIYAVAAQLAYLARLGIVAVNPALSPIAATADPDRLCIVARTASRLAFVPALAFTCVLIVAGPWVLRLFSATFAAGYAPMVTLAVGLMLVTALGPVDTVLIMKGRQRLVATGAAIATAINIALNAALIPRWGMQGAAIATAISALVWGLIMTVAVNRSLGFGMSVFASGRWAKSSV